jgi:hypothetical protein
MLADSCGLEVWCEDEAGPFQTQPGEGESWQPEGLPKRQEHEYQRAGTAKVLTLFRPRDGQVRMKGVRSCTNEVLHGWLESELEAIVGRLPHQDTTPSEAEQPAWLRWQEGLQVRFTLRTAPPPLRMLLVLDNLVGHHTPSFVRWCIDHGIMLLYTPLSGSWLNMAESIQRILKRRALGGAHPRTPEEIMMWFEEVAAAWNRNPTPFEWGGKRAVRRARRRARRHAQGGSGAYTRRPIRRLKRSLLDDWQCSAQVTH